MVTSLARPRICVPMRARSIDEQHRGASQLELLFDLTFVIAVAGVTEQLARHLAEGDFAGGLAPFLQVFFAIWWAWMNFTWFASSYDTDDVPYRLLTLLQMAGVLVLAAGVRRAVVDDDYLAVTVGYLVMRIGLVALWLRAGHEDPERGSTARRYAIGISIAEVGWLVRLALDEAGLLPPGWSRPIFVALVVAELAVPRWAERKLPTTWHPHHMAERYGLFTIILLGESLVATSSGVDAVLREGRVSVDLVATALAGLVLLFALWWLYFLGPFGEGLANRRDRSFLWGYGHYGIFAALAALGAGLHVAVEHAGHTIPTSPFVAAYAVAVPVSVFLATLSVLHAGCLSRRVIRPGVTLGAALLVLWVPLAASVTSPAVAVAAIATVCAAAVTAALLEHRRAGTVGRIARDRSRHLTRKDQP
ncbi:MAG: low temperature requirement protein A [Ilumatobacteraceae bacterium]